MKKLIIITFLIAATFSMCGQPTVPSGSLVVQYQDDGTHWTNAMTIDLSQAVWNPTNGVYELTLTNSTDETTTGQRFFRTVSTNAMEAVVLYYSVLSNTASQVGITAPALPDLVSPPSCNGVVAILVLIVFGVIIYIIWKFCKNHLG